MSMKHLTDKIQKLFYERYEIILTQEKIAFVINAALTEIKEVTVKEPFILKGFGKFYPIKKRDKKHNSPICPDVKVIPSHTAINFTPSKEYSSLVKYKNEVNNNNINIK